MCYSDENHLQFFTILYKYKDCNYKHFRLTKMAFLGCHFLRKWDLG